MSQPALRDHEASESVVYLTMRKRRMFPGERLLVRMLTRRYVQALRVSDGRLPGEDLAAEATARLSIDGIHRLREALMSERERMRDSGDAKLADALTSAIRQLDSRAQILDDLLH